MIGEPEFFLNSSTLLISVTGIYQSIETQPKWAKWNCSQGQFKMEYKIKKKNIKHPKCLPGFVTVANEERLYTAVLGGGEKKYKIWVCV